MKTRKTTKAKKAEFPAVDQALAEIDDFFSHIHNPAREREARAELRRAGIITRALCAYDLRVYLSADESRLLAWHWDAATPAMMKPDEVLDEAERGPNIGVLAEVEQTGATAVCRTRVRVTSRRAVVVTDWEAPDAFDGIGWGNRTVELAPTGKERSAGK